MNKIELNEKEYFVGKSPDDINLDTYEKIRAVMINRVGSGYSYSDILDITSILTGIPKDEFLENSPVVFDEIFKLTKWVYDINFNDYSPKDYIEIKGKKYFYDDDESNLTLHEYIDADIILKDFPAENQLSAVLAVRLRELNKKHKTDDINTQMELFKTAKLSSVLGFINFFLSKEKESQIPGQLFFHLHNLALMNQEALEYYHNNLAGNRSCGSLPMKMYSKQIKSWRKTLTKYSV